jgi:hypothetical protein
VLTPRRRRRRCCCCRRRGRRFRAAGCGELLGPAAAAAAAAAVEGGTDKRQQKGMDARRSCCGCGGGCWRLGCCSCRCPPCTTATGRRSWLRHCCRQALPLLLPPQPRPPPWLPLLRLLQRRLLPRGCVPPDPGGDLQG